MQKAEAILRTLLPGLNLDDDKFDARGIDQIIESSRRPKAAPVDMNGTEDDAQLQSMVENTGSLDLDPDGHWDYYGHSSGMAFMRRLKDQFAELFVPDPRSLGPQFNPRTLAITRLIDSPTSVASSSFETSSSTLISDLPDRKTCKELCQNALDDACALMRFIHKPSFYEKFDHIFDTDPEHFTNDDMQFMPLLYSVIALGCMFARDEKSGLGEKGYETAIERG